jgi:hypothetical protein
MKYLRILGQYAAGAVLLIYGLAVLVFTGAFAAMVAKHFGAGEFRQGVIFAVVCIYLFRSINWLVDKADL